MRSQAATCAATRRWCPRSWRPWSWRYSPNNLGVLWAAVEATTIVTAFLVGHRRSRGSVEATWKYVVICSVGIALAYLGTILVYYAARQTSIPSSGALDWSQLAAHADELDPGVMRIAFALLVLGFGAKAGMIPLHSWLPDAHSQAPAPVSALMSGVLLPVAVYALIRYRVIAVEALSSLLRPHPPARGGAHLAGAGRILDHRPARLQAAAGLLEHRAHGAGRDRPRASAPRLAIAAGLLHILGHGLGKAVLFCGAGQVLVSEAHHPDRRGPRAAGPTPGARGRLRCRVPGAPRACRRSACSPASSGWPGPPPTPGSAGLSRSPLTLLVVVFVAITVQLVPMILGSGPTVPDPTTRGDAAAVGSSAPLVVGLSALVLLGVVAWPLDQLLHTASLIGGTR